jgi:tRNA A37 threonylcarbamoyladenosine modification protein TsaB
VPVHGVCSLDALAWAAPPGGGRAGPLAVVTDARRSEVYWATYSDGVTCSSGPDVGAPVDVARHAEGLTVVGPGTSLYAFRGAVSAAPVSAAALAGLAVRRLLRGERLLPPRPLYLRRPDAQPPGPRKPVLA